jgi:hypothetical protein
MSLARMEPIIPAFTFKNGRSTLHAFTSALDKEHEAITITSFPISWLPAEIRNEIYACYLASLPPLSINSDNISSSLHEEIPLSLSSPYFKSDIQPSSLYSNLTFSFSSPKVLRQFAKTKGRHRVAKLRIEYGKLSRCHHTDWVFVLFHNFEKPEEVTFVLQGGGNGEEVELFQQWWECVKGAMREASNCRNGNTGKKGKRGVMLSVECGNWNICELVGGC